MVAISEEPSQNQWPWCPRQSRATLARATLKQGMWTEGDLEFQVTLSLVLVIPERLLSVSLSC